MARDGHGDLKRGDAISRFVVLETLGAGGMGIVYSAYDADLDRKVAIKLLASTLNNADASARLLREAQAMAKINHPNVIKIHEVGKLDDQIYLAMEFADAGTLRGWLLEKHDVREILDAFIEAGNGLVAAHAADLVHRDFKPDNVLRSKSGAVQVMDFGLVSTSNTAHGEPAPEEGPLSSTTPLSQQLTRTGSIMGTQTYMAPEQFAGGVTTARTDQFSFCVALYEALYGSRPFAGATYVELMANVLDGQVLPAPAGSNVAPWLRRVLLRGLALDPANRFESMAALLAALQHDPRRRRRRVFAALGGVALVGAAIAAVMMVRGRGSCNSGDERIAEVWTPQLHTDVQRAFTTANRPNAKTAFDKLASMVDAWNGTWKQGYVGACRATASGEQSAHALDLRMQCLTQKLDEEHDVLALIASGDGEAIDHSLDAIAALPSVTVCADGAALAAEIAPPTELATKGAFIEVRAQLRNARALYKIGRVRLSLDAARSALVAARASGYVPAIADAQIFVGTLEAELAEPDGGAMLAEAMKSATIAGDDEVLLQALAARVNVLTLASHYDAARELADVADALASRGHLSMDVRVQSSTAIAYLLARTGRPEQAVARYQQTLAFVLREHGGPLVIANVASLLAIVYQDQGRFEDARKTYEKALEIDTQLFGENNADIANVLNNIGNVYRVEGKLDDAKKAYDRALAIRLATLGPDNPNLNTSYLSLGNYYGDANDVATAASYYEKDIALLDKTLGSNSEDLIAPLTNLAELKRKKGDLAGARADYGRARAIVEAIGPDRPSLAAILNGLGVIAENDDKYEEALALYTRSEQIIEKVYGPDHPDVVDMLVNLIGTYRHLHRYDDAEAIAKRAEAAATKAYNAQDVHVGGVYVNWGEVEIDEHHFAAGLDHEQKALKLFEAALPKDHPFIAFALVGIGEAFVGDHKPREALPYYERALAIDTAADVTDGLPEIQFNIAIAAIGDPKTKAHALASAKAALATYKQVGNTEKIAEVSAWLKKH